MKQPNPAHRSVVRPPFWQTVGLVLTLLVVFLATRDLASAAGTLQLTPTADSFVNQGAPTKNFGTKTFLDLKSSQIKISYLKFDLTPLAGRTVTSAQLIVKLDSTAKSNPTLRAVADTTWAERSITYSNRPALGSAIATLPAVGLPIGSEVCVDVTAYVSANVGRLISLGLEQGSSGSLRLLSRESAGTPRLVVSYDGAAPDLEAPLLEQDADGTGAIYLPLVEGANAAPPCTPPTTPTPGATHTPQPSATPTVGATATATPPTIPTSVPPATPTPGPSATPPPGPSGLRAFPGAEGFGAQETIGGRGGRIIYVTNLNDSGEGSLRAALETSGPRMVLFRVAGTIALQDDIEIDDPYVTIAGQSAPGDGVQLRGGMIVIKTHDVIIRYLRIRSGDEPNASDPGSRDALTLSGSGGDEAYNIIIDHSSLVWGPDIGGAAILQNAHHLTIQNSILGEGLHYSNHPEGIPDNGGHSLALNLTQMDPARYGPGYPMYITLHHNLLTTSDHRMPQVLGGEFVDIVNNVIYNWGVKAGHGNPRKLNLIGNMFIPGPQTTRNVAWFPDTSSALPTLFTASVYEQNNVFQGSGTIRGNPSSVYASTRFSPYSMSTTQSAQEAYQLVVADVGATRPVRDAVDLRIVNNLVTRQGTFLNGVNGPAPTISWPTLASGPVPTDADGDGMPDAWEVQHFGNTNRGSASNSSGDFDGDGYTDVEEYLNSTNPTQS